MQDTKSSVAHPRPAKPCAEPNRQKPQDVEQNDCNVEEKDEIGEHEREFSPAMSKCADPLRRVSASNETCLPNRVSPHRLRRFIALRPTIVAGYFLNSKRVLAMINRFSAAAFAALAVLALTADAQTKAPKPTKASEISVETFFQRPKYVSMALSPTGDLLGALAPAAGRTQLAIVDLKNRSANVLTSFKDFDVVDFLWINDNRLFFRVGDTKDASGEQRYRGTYAIDRDGSNVRDLTGLLKSTGFRQVVPLAQVLDGSDDMIVAANERTADFLDAYRLNTKSGRFTQLTFDNPGETTGFLVDRNLVPRIAISRGEGSKSIVYHRANADAKWEKIAENDIVGEAFNPLQFDYDNRTLYVSAHNGKDRAAIYKYNTDTKKLGDLVFEHPLIDVSGGLIFDRSQKKLVGISYNADRQETKWFDPKFETLQKQIDQSLKGLENTLSFAPLNPKNMLIFSASDTFSGDHSLFDTEKLTLEKLPGTREWLPRELMPTRKFIKYKARDGMEIPAYLTIPAGSDGKNLPLVVNVHGGPNVRGFVWSSWGRPEAQFFASRGYAVLEPEFRGSRGYGRKHYESGLVRWGYEMQDDIDDGVLHLAKEGIAEKGRACLYGGSYGGYAAKWGAIRNPELYRCGITLVGVSDIELTYNDKSIYTRGKISLQDRVGAKTLGDVKDSAQRAKWAAVSPVEQAAKLQRPLLISYGREDGIVPLVHGERFKAALEKAGKQFEWVVYDGEAHGYSKDENVIDWNKRVEKFLATHLAK
jgi:dipeptidyl aminopeptidase/acylaminoacyl peptidase